MNFQQYETLQDKSDKYIKYLVQNIQPKFTKSEMKAFLDNSFRYFGKKSSKIEYVEIGDDLDQLADLSNLTKSQLKKLYQVFISREDTSSLAVKWRFYQYLKYIHGFVFNTVKVSLMTSDDEPIDMKIEFDAEKLTFVVSVEILELTNYQNLIEKISKYIEQTKLIPNRIIFIAFKSYRNVPIQDTLEILEKEVQTELWVEWFDDKISFSGDDLIIINDSELKVAGFNFTNLDDLLDYTYEYTDGGQVRIHAQRRFFSENTSEEPEMELIWKGIMLKENN